MDKIKNLLKKKKLLFLLVPLAIIVFLISGKGQEKKELYTVKSGDVIQSVVLSGKIETSNRADLGFASSGRIAQIYVNNNQKVKQGQILAQLEIGDLLADLRIKEANLKTSNLDLDSAKENLTKITKQEDNKVANAYRSLLSADLELTPESETYTVSTPEVSGIYNSEIEGEYKIIIEKTSSSSADFYVRTFGLEKSQITINKEGKTKLGTRGLYIDFPSDLSLYQNTVWYLEIPNKAGASYLVNYNAYIDAKNHRDLAVQDAQVALDKLLVEDGGGDSVAQAEIQKINAEIRKNTIYAPFSGIATNIEKENGENASTGEVIVSVLGEDTLEVVLQVSELDVSKLTPGMNIEVTLDAFPNEIFAGILKTINSKETTVDGVPVYEAFVELAPDSRIKAGMSATGNVVLAKAENVLAVPVYILEKRGEKYFAKVEDAEGKRAEKEVFLGLIGSDNLAEILSGLSLGEVLEISGKN